MQIARFEPRTSVEGPGERSAIWLQGCSIRCPACCNPQMQPLEGGLTISPVELAQKIVDAAADGLTLLGGEPLDQASELFSMLQHLKTDYAGGIILFTGYRWEEILVNHEQMRVVELCDIIVAGPFSQAHTPDTRRWIGSTNQTVHFISDFYHDLQKKWPENRREIEIILRNGEIMINGTPLDSEHELSRMFTHGMEG